MRTITFLIVIGIFFLLAAVILNIWVFYYKTAPEFITSLTPEISGITIEIILISIVYSIIDQRNQSGRKFDEVATRNRGKLDIEGKTFSNENALVAKEVLKLRNRKSFIGLDFSNQQFSDCNFKEIDLSNCCLVNSSFVGCDFDDASFFLVDLEGSYFTNCSFEGVNFWLSRNFEKESFSDCRNLTYPE